VHAKSCPGGALVGSSAELADLRQKALAQPTGSRA
jgi:hypothetical protein